MYQLLLSTVSSALRNQIVFVCFSALPSSKYFQASACHGGSLPLCDLRQPNYLLRSDTSKQSNSFHPCCQTPKASSLATQAEAVFLSRFWDDVYVRPGEALRWEASSSSLRKILTNARKRLEAQCEHRLHLCLAFAKACVTCSLPRI